MSNEEKILAMLEALTDKVNKIEASQAEMQKNQAEMQNAQTEMRDTLTRVAITQENIILPRLETLAEGHTHLLNTLAPKERVEVLEDRVITLETVIKSMSKRLTALEKAQ